MDHRPLQALAQQFHEARLLFGHGPGGDAQQAGYPGDDFETITPLEVVDQFLGEDIEDILDQYNNLMENNGMYMAFMDENELLMGFALNTQDRIVTSIVLLYNEDLTDEDIIDYYTKAGYTCTDTGEVDEDEETPIYLFSNPNTGILITYSGLRGVATQLPL